MTKFLEDLTLLHDDLVACGALKDDGFLEATIQGVISIDRDGRLLGGRRIGKGAFGQRLSVPALPNRTSGIVASFLTGKSEYWFGGDGRAALQREAMRTLHKTVLAGCDDPMAQAVLALLDRDHDTSDLPPVNGMWIVEIDGVLAHEVEALRRAWRNSDAVAADENPRIRVIPQYGNTRLVSSNVEAAKSHGQDKTAFPPSVSGSKAGRALNWLLDRPSTLRLDNTAFVAWLADDPQNDPTEYLLPIWRSGSDEMPLWRGRLHLAVIDSRPPGRISTRLHWSGEAEEARERLQSFYDHLWRVAYYPFKSVRRPNWLAAFRDSPRSVELITWTLQAVLDGMPIGNGVMSECIRLMRRDNNPNPPRIALIGVCLGTNKEEAGPLWRA